MILQAGSQVDGTGSQPMNNTLMSSVPITVKLTSSWDTGGKGDEEKQEDMKKGVEGVRKLLVTHAGTH